MKKRHKILIVDDHAILRSGLTALLSREEDFEVVGGAADGREGVQMVKDLSPDVVVMDLRMPHLNGIDAARQALALKPDIKIIALSANTDERSKIEMLRSGAMGFVSKEAVHEELINAIRTVLQGRVFFDPGTIARMADKGSAEADLAGVFRILSPREREVLQLIAEGSSTKEIANQLNVSIKTAETHRRNLMEKLHIDGVAELTKYAIREGLTGL